MKQRECPACGGTEARTGKLSGVAAVLPLEARTGLGGSELLVTFCAQCGEVWSLRVKDPEKFH